MGLVAQDKTRSTFGSDEAFARALRLVERFSGREKAKVFKETELLELAEVFLSGPRRVSAQIGEGLDKLPPERLSELLKRLSQLASFTQPAIRALKTSVEFRLNAQGVKTDQEQEEASTDLPKANGSYFPPAAQLATAAPIKAPQSNSPNLAQERISSTSSNAVEGYAKERLLEQIRRECDPRYSGFSIEQLVAASEQCADPERLCIAAEIASRFGAERVCTTGIMEPLITNPNNSCKSRTERLWECIKELRKLERAR